MKAMLFSFVLSAGLVFSSTLVFADGNHAPIGEDAKHLPIFDAHVHYKQPAWSPYPVESVIELMDESGVAMALVSSTPDQGTIMLYEFAPNRIVPELRPYHGIANSSNWTAISKISDYISERLEKHPHEGIGEFHIRGEAMWNEPLMRDVIAMANERDIPLHVHSAAEPIRWIYSVDPEVKVIWAHAGLVEPADEVYRLMAEFPTLYADTSLKDRSIYDGEGALNPEWKKIIFDFQDRLMLGSDTWVNGQWDQYAEIIDVQRQWLALLPKEVAEKLAYKNAETYFGRRISMDQIGTK